MKAIVKFKLYDTEKATHIATKNPKDTTEWKESLYKTKKGNFFLVCEQKWVPSYVRPITVKEAMDWMKRHFNLEQVIATFKEYIEEA